MGKKRLAVLFVKFAIVGVINTAIDFGVLNFLILVTGITSGKHLIILNTISFLIAVTNSYILNKYWSFNKNGRIKIKESLQFIFITVIGLAINNGIIFIITEYISAPVSDETLWVNIAKAMATVVTLFWNFSGYKMFVFKDTSYEEPIKVDEEVN